MIVPKGYKHIQGYIPFNTWRKMKMQAFRENVKIQDLFDRIITEYLERKEALIQQKEIQAKQPISNVEGSVVY